MSGEHERRTPLISSWDDNMPFIVCPYCLVQNEVWTPSLGKLGPNKKFDLGTRLTPLVYSKPTNRPLQRCHLRIGSTNSVYRQDNSTALLLKMDNTYGV